MPNRTRGAAKSEATRRGWVGRRERYTVLRADTWARGLALLTLACKHCPPELAAEIRAYIAAGFGP